MTEDQVGRLIELGRDGEAAHLAVRDAGGTIATEAAVVGPMEQLDVLIPGFVRLASQDREGLLDLPTPCEGWVVRDLLGHVNGGARAFAAAFEERPVRERELGDDPADTVAEALADFDVAVRSAGALERTVASPFGPMPGEVFARLAALDLLMHSWDLSRATGQDLALPDGIVQAADEFARQAVTDDLRTPGVFGPEVAAPANSSRLDALAAFTGRRP
jgi:uncharacterized protein (TIGR03086 family)